MSTHDATLVPAHPPPRPKRLSVRFDRSGDSLTLDYQVRGWVLSGCLLFWLTGWGVGCGAVTMLAAGDPKPFNIFLVFVFCGWWVVVAGCLIWVLFGHERLVLERRGASFSRRAIVLLLSREVPLGELRSFEGYTEVSGGRSRTVRHGIEMRTAGEGLRFAEGIAVGERDWLTFQLNDHLQSLSGTGEQAASHDWPAAVATLVVGDSTHAPVAPPSDARWERLDDRDSIVFADKGWFSVGALVGFLAVNMLWNGIVSVFVLGLCGVGPVGPQGAAW